jgi:hypothetical protein
MATGTVVGMQLRRLLAEETGGRGHRYNSDADYVCGCHGVAFFNNPRNQRS